MDPPSDLDPTAVRRQFARRAGRLQGADFLYREIERRMLARLELVRIAPALALDIGCGLGSGVMALRQRFPAAAVAGIDFAAPVLREARARLAPPRSGFLARLRSTAPSAPDLVCADAHALPFSSGSVGMIWSNVLVHWLADPARAFSEWARVLEPGGLLMFSTFGPDTLRELRAAGAHLMAFRDMHDVGDALVGAGFAEPVMDVEQITLQFARPDDLLRDLRALGGNALRTRARGLGPPRAIRRWAREFVAAQAPARIGFEVVYGLAWGRSARARDGTAPIVLHRRGASRPRG